MTGFDNRILATVVVAIVRCMAKKPSFNLCYMAGAYSRALKPVNAIIPLSHRTWGTVVTYNWCIMYSILIHVLSSSYMYTVNKMPRTVFLERYCLSNLSSATVFNCGFDKKAVSI